MNKANILFLLYAAEHINDLTVEEFYDNFSPIYERLQELSFQEDMDMFYDEEIEPTERSIDN